jgi:hypothetical protein
LSNIRGIGLIHGDKRNKKKADKTGNKQEPIQYELSEVRRKYQEMTKEAMNLNLFMMRNPNNVLNTKNDLLPILIVIVNAYGR